jgi:hypothetical protein
VKNEPAARAALAAQIDARLRAACSSPNDAPGRDEGVDMSAEAITARLEEAAAMSSLCLELGALGEAARRS